ncbi:MAG TPA: hypothetical protein VFK82_05695, partial [Burkholderiaceae bacterium]|nr:hypothetical protein [Burkholderiaceae bacterium]
IIHRFKYLKYALSVVLIFIGAKIFYNQIYGKMDAWISLSVTFGLLAIGVIYSLYKTRGDKPELSLGDAVAKTSGQANQPTAGKPQT